MDKHLLQFIEKLAVIVHRSGAKGNQNGKICTTVKRFNFTQETQS